MCKSRFTDFLQAFDRATTSAGRAALIEAIEADESVPLCVRESALDYADNALPLENPVERIVWARWQQERRQRCG